MAAAQPTRTRSTRLNANTSRTLQPPAPTASAAFGTSAAPGNGGVSALSLFLTNIRLLDLDLLPGWPNISAETFVATGTSAQGQKKRVHCVEWALFQLFALWDPEETRSVSWPCSL